MPAVPIDFKPSSRIRALVYDADTQELHVEFSRGHIYTYHGVSGEMADGFAQAPSAGQYLNQIVGELEYSRKS